MTDFSSHPANRLPVPIITLRASEDWQSQTCGPVSLTFNKRRGDTIVEYVRIDGVPSDMTGRAIVVWCLAHPWRVGSIVRMWHAWAKMKMARRVR